MTYLLRLVACLFLCVSLNSFGALYDRGNGLIYDDVLDITWLQDADHSFTSGYDDNGDLTWDGAHQWAQQLVYFGYDNWRLPSANLMNPSNPCWSNIGDCDSGYNNDRGELGHMFYNNLNILPKYDINNNYQTGHGITDGQFTDGETGNNVSILNIQVSYWLSEGLVSNAGDAWIFEIFSGRQAFTDKPLGLAAWAVHDGDIGASPVPLPAAAWLFGSALVGLGLVRRRK